MYQKRLNTAQGSVTVGQATIPYSVVSEDFLLTDLYGNEETTTSTFSYFRSDDCSSDTRPVVFVYNGGPGAASFPLHMGGMAPRRLKMGDITKLPVRPPYELEDNYCSIIDICDVVMYDPPGVGYNYFLNAQAPEKYYACDADADALVETIKQWLTAHKRWNSPVYLLGESYGSIRSALAAYRLMYGCGPDRTTYSLIQLNGVIILGSCLNTDETSSYLLKEAVHFMPIAATHWYHRLKESGISLEDFTEEAYAFSMNEYLPALAQGNLLPEEQKLKVAQRIEHFSGVPVDTVLKRDLKIDPYWYAANGLSDMGLSTGIYDSRFTAPQMGQLSFEDFFCADPSNFAPLPALTRSFLTYAQSELNIEADHSYVPLNGNTERLWSYKCEFEPGVALKKAMTTNPDLRVLFVSGYYDMLTTMSAVRYIAGRYGLPKDRVEYAKIQSGHTAVLGEENSNEVCRRVRSFIAKTMI